MSGNNPPIAATPEGVNPENNYVNIGPLINTNRLRNNNNQNPLFNVRDRLFHTLFFRTALAYARTVPKPVRRVIEFMILLKAICAFFVLVYIHMAFTKAPVTCLDHIKGSWPRDGILRVEILRNAGHDYSIEKSYAKEQKLKHEKDEDFTSMLGFVVRDGVINIEPSSVEDNNNKETEPLEELYRNQSDLTENKINIYNFLPSSIENLSENVQVRTTAWNDLQVMVQTPVETETAGSAVKYPNQSAAMSSLFDVQEKLETQIKRKISTSEKSSKAAWPEDEYIVEYSLEYGFLRLSPTTRARLGIPVQIVTLDPGTDVCFGDSFSRLILEEFLGFDDLLMASIKALAEKEDNKGYLRNVVTGEHYRFVSMWMARSSYFAAFFIMIVFTVSVSMLLRYSHHQIFVFIVDLLQMLEFNVTVTFPAAPLLTVILALVEMEYPGGKNQHFRHLLFFAFHRGQKAAAATRNICNVYGEGVIGESTAQKWFAKFKNGDFDLDDTPRSGRPSELDEERLKALLQEDGRQTSRELTDQMNCTHMTVLNQLYSMGFAEKLGAWVAHELTENNKENRLQIAAQHLAGHRAIRGHKATFFVPNRHGR